MLRINQEIRPVAVKYRTAKMKPSTKALYVNKWHAFHEAFPQITLREWCIKHEFSEGTFSGWLSDPRYNRNLRKPSKPETESTEEQETATAEKGEQLSFMDYLDVPLADETESEKEACRIAKEYLSGDSQKTTKESESIPPFSVETEPDKEPENLSFAGPFITFTCPDYRIEISKVIPIQDVNRILGFTSSMMHRKAIKQAQKTALA